MHPVIKPVEDTGANITSPLVKREEQFLGAYITLIECDSKSIFVGLGNGHVCQLPQAAVTDADKKTIYPTQGLPLCSAHTKNDGLLVGTDSGRLVKINEKLSALVSRKKGWVEQLAVSADKSYCAYSSGKDFAIITFEGELVFSSSVEQGTITGLHFNSNAEQLAMSHYGGVTVWDISAGVKRHQLEWHGAHLSIHWSPDNQFIVTTTQDKELHCWALPNEQRESVKSIRMSGYPAKIRQLSWTADEQHLAASGADSVTVWSFVDDDPSGKPPYEFGYVFQGVVTQVASHPAKAIVAAGYNNGAVLIGKYKTGNAIIARPPCGHFITSMTWNSQGDKLFVGMESGLLVAIDLLEDDF